MAEKSRRPKMIDSRVCLRADLKFVCSPKIGGRRGPPPLDPVTRYIDEM